MFFLHARRPAGHRRLAGDAGAAPDANLIPADRGHPPARADEAEDERLTERTDERREGMCRARDAGRPGPQRPGPRQRIRHGEGPRLMYVEKYSHVMHLVSALEGNCATSSTRWMPGRLLSGRNAERRAQGSSHGNHRGTRAGAPWRLWRRRSCMPISGQSRLLHRDPDHGDAR